MTQSAERPPAGARQPSFWAPFAQPTFREIWSITLLGNIVNTTLRDLMVYAAYKAAVPAPIGKYGGEHLARGGAHELLAGNGSRRHWWYSAFLTARRCTHS